MKLFLCIFNSLLLISIANSNNITITPSKSTQSTILKSSCSTTLYPDLCYSAIATVPEHINKVSSQKEVIALSLDLTITMVQHNFFHIQNLMMNTQNLTKREKAALHDCLELTDETLDELRDVKRGIDVYPNNNYGKSIFEYSGDMKNSLSSAMTSQETCVDGLSEGNVAKHVREVVVKREVLAKEMCSNVLAMIKNMTDIDIANEDKVMGRKLNAKEHNYGWPQWLSAGDRQLFQSSTVTPDVVVAADGSGDFWTVAAAVAAAPEKSSRRYIIRIKRGVYKENVEVPKKKTNIMFLGDGRVNTIITGSRNVADGSTTFRSATVAAVGKGFLARDITFQNTAGPSKGQAVALRVSADMSAFYQCNILAYQDTLYTHCNRQFYINCLVAGTVDMVFGNAAVVIQDCDIHARRPNPGQSNMITAQGRSDPSQPTGIVIQKCKISATSDLKPVQSEFLTFLGRPWRQYSRTVVMQSSMGDLIDPAGWHEWNDGGGSALNTLFYGEYQNSGSGAGTSRRVKWKGFKVLTSDNEAQSFTARRFIGGSSWLGSTGFPFSLDL